jgi:hypothetical protein
VSETFLNHIACGMKSVINHKNFIITDNRVENLEIITQRQNTNKKHIKSTSKYVGVYWCKQRKKWKVQAQVNGKGKYLGLFTDEKKASNCYNDFISNLK